MIDSQLDNNPPPDECTANNKMKNIEFLRFILAWLIAFFHFFQSSDLFGWKEKYFENAWLGVEMFFVISFFFLVLHTDKNKIWYSFCLQKWFRLAPLIIVVTVAGYVLHLCGVGTWSYIDNLENILLVHTWLNFPAEGAFVGWAWYCNIFFGISLMYLLLVKCLSKQHLCFLIALLSFVGVCGMVTPERFGFISSYAHNGLCRALFTLGIGYMIANAYRGRGTYSRRSKVVYSALECCGVLILFCILVFFSELPLSIIPIVLAVFSLLLWSFINNCGFISSLLERNWCALVGRYSYAIYIVHLFVKKVAVYGVYHGYIQGGGIKTALLIIFIMCVATMILAISSYHFIEAPILRWYKMHFYKNK